jgi:hypothetical protein
MKSFLDKAFKFFAITIGVITALIIAFYFFFNDKIPMGSDPVFAQEQVTKMHKALNKSAWNSTRYIAWMTNNSRHYLWDKKNGFVQIRWKGYRVLFHQTSNASKVYNGDVEVTDENKKAKLVKLAKKKFRTDSYWFSAPYLVNEYQLTKDMVLLPEESKRSLCVRFPSSHTFRDDEVYVYRLDEKFFPTSWKMWTNNFLIGGLETEWLNWKKSETGFYYPTKHRRELGGDIDIQHFKAGKNLTAIGINKNPFVLLK